MLDIIVFVSPLVQVHAAKIRLYTSFTEAKIHGFQRSRAPSQNGGPMTIKILKALETHPKVLPWKFNKSFFVCVRSEVSSVLQCDDGPPL
jgi:hypothetical protein